MRVSEIHLRNFKRFTDLTVGDIPESARLVVVTGLNGSGKSAILESFQFLRRRSHWGISDPNYYQKMDIPLGQPPTTAPSMGNINESAEIRFHDHTPRTADEWKRAIWVRSPYRHESDFNIPGINRQMSPVEDEGSARLIDGDRLVANNYSRLVSSSIELLYANENRGRTAGDITDSIVGSLKAALVAVFDDLTLNNLVDPMAQGTFFFGKGATSNYPFKDLSSGERAAFDLLLDMTVRASAFVDTVFCIDEPELHLSTGVQARVLTQLLKLLPGRSQMWIATHSIGMMKAALELRDANPGEVVFLDTHGVAFDGISTMSPIEPDRTFWARSLRVALDDLASLISPSVLVFCEGRFGLEGFDAQVYRTIFSSRADVEFVSVGNSTEVQSDSSGLANTIQVITPGTEIRRIRDRDDLSQTEVERLLAAGVRTLTHRHIESYLFSDEVLSLLCASFDQAELATAVISKKAALLAASARSGGAPDDVKKIAKSFRAWLVRELQLVASGSTTREFARQFLVPLITPGTETYALLESDVFGRD